MLKGTLLRYTGYNIWANEILLTLIEKQIDNSKIDKVIVSSFPSLRKTIYHIWDAEWIWYKRLNNESPTDGPGKSFSGTFLDAKEKILAIDKHYIEFIDKSSEEDLVLPFTYKNIEGKVFTNPVWESVLHCMNHSTYHRGQVVTLLRQHGLTEIPSTDFISFVRLK